MDRAKRDFGGAVESFPIQNTAMMEVRMIRTALLAAALVAAILLAGCGTSSEGSRYQDQHGVAKDSGYPKGNPRDSGSPALGSSSQSEESKEGAKTESPESKKPK